jgi:hypothetical protein
MSICGKTELCVFDGAPAQTMVESATFADIHPTAIIDGKSANIEFSINASETEYLDLNDTMIYLKLTVKSRTGADILPEANTTPVNHFLNALFSDATLSLNDTVIEGGDRLYSYKATIENIFNFSKDTKRIQLDPAGYSDDDDIRKAWIVGSREFELAGALRFDFFNQPKYLIPGVNVRIQLQRNKPAFALLVTNNTTPVIEINKAVLYVRRVRVNTALALGHQMGLLKQNAIYPITKTKVITYTLAKGSMSYFKDNIFSSLRLPKFVVVGFVKALAFAGDYRSNPFNFEHFNVNSVGLLCDGQAIPFRDIYEPDFANKLYTREFQMSMIQNTEHFNTDKNNGVTMKMFAEGGHCLFTFNLTPDLTMGACQPPRDGNLRLDVKFAQPLAEGINVIIYGIFDGEVQLGKNKQVIRPL